MEANETPKPLLPPLTRVLLYLLACLIVFCFGAGVSIGLVLIWLFIKYGGTPDFERLPFTERSLFFVAISTGVYVLFIGVTVLFATVIDRRPLSHFGLQRRGWAQNLLLGCLWAAAFVGLMFGIYATTGWVRFSVISNIPWGMWLIATVWLYPLIGVAEEMVFRGYLLSVLEEWRGRRLAIIVTCILFWLMHLGQGNIHEPLGMVAMLTAGLTFALARYITGSLWFPIGLHAVYNWLAISLGGDPRLGMPTLLKFEPQVPHWLIGPPMHAGVLDVAFGLLLLLSIVVVLPKLSSADASPRKPQLSQQVEED